VCGEKFVEGISRHIGSVGVKGRVRRGDIIKP
jgi:hypothetical protein